MPCPAMVIWRTTATASQIDHHRPDEPQALCTRASQTHSPRSTVLKEIDAVPGRFEEPAAGRPESLPVAGGAALHLSGLALRGSVPRLCPTYAYRGRPSRPIRASPRTFRKTLLGTCLKTCGTPRCFPGRGAGRHVTSCTYHRYTLRRPVPTSLVHERMHKHRRLETALRRGLWQLRQWMHGQRAARRGREPVRWAARDSSQRAGRPDAKRDRCDGYPRRALEPC